MKSNKKRNVCCQYFFLEKEPLDPLLGTLDDA